MKTARNNGYKIDYSTNTVTVTKKFMEEAGIIGTPEFNQRKILADMGLTFKIKETAPRKNNKITYAQMIKYISCVENSSLYMAQFDAIREEAKSKNNPYNRVLEWFKDTFPCFYDMPEFNAKNEVIVTPADYLTALPEVA